MEFEFSKEQQEALDRPAREAEAKELAPIMRRNFPEETKNLDDEQLRNEVATALHRAAQWGVKTRKASVNFVMLRLLLGADFDTSEDVKSFLGTPFVSGDAKVNAFMGEFKWRLHLEAQGKGEAR